VKFNRVIALILLITASCKVQLNNKKYQIHVSAQDLPESVLDAYEQIFSMNSDLPMTINLDSNNTQFSFIKNTSQELRKSGHEVFQINSKRFYLKWNENSISRPYVLHGKYLYMVNTKSAVSKNNYYLLDNLMSNRYIKIDLNKHLSY